MQNDFLPMFHIVVENRNDFFCHHLMIHNYNYYYNNIKNQFNKELDEDFYENFIYIHRDIEFDEYLNFNCINCYNCYCCIDCKGCFSCFNCELCDKCNLCFNCNSCSNCKKCTDSLNCNMCNKIKSCNYINCCNNCIKCSFCNNCNHCNNCNNCNNCNHTQLLKFKNNLSVNQSSNILFGIFILCYLFLSMVVLITIDYVNFIKLGILCTVLSLLFKYFIKLRN